MPLSARVRGSREKGAGMTDGHLRATESMDYIGLLPFVPIKKLEYLVDVFILPLLSMMFVNSRGSCASANCVGLT